MAKLFSTKMYPEIKISLNKNPSRFYAIPLIGFFIKLLMVIPVGIEVYLVGIAVWVFSIINSFGIFFTGKYSKTAYNLNLGLIRLSTNVSFFLFGLTDKYPGFALDTTNYDLDVEFNKTPSRLLATPILGMIIRGFLLIPYFIYRQVVQTAFFLAIIVSWIPVLFNGKYPATTHEITRDSVRIDQAVSVYFLGLSDSYPSWYIDMHHKGIKLLLIILAIIITLLSWGGHGWGKWNWNNMQLRRNSPMMRYPTNTGRIPTNFNY